MLVKSDQGSLAYPLCRNGRFLCLDITKRSRKIESDPTRNWGYSWKL